MKTHVKFTSGRSRLYKGRLRPMTLADIENVHGRVEAWALVFDKFGLVKTSFKIWG